MSAVKIIAEAGVNHNGRLDLALKLVDAAAGAGADIVKFQTFRADQLATRSAGKAEYQTRNTGTAESQLEMLKALELDDEAHLKILAHCKSRGIEFLSTPFDFVSLKLLIDGLKVERLKIGSGDLTHAPLLLEIGRSGRALILSTGMATVDEVREALGTLAFGYAGTGEPDKAKFKLAFASAAGQAALREKVVLLHCTSDYPAPDDEINLKAMGTLAATFGLQVGFSDHSRGISVAIAAVALGARMIEKHLTLDRTMPGPDHVASIEPDEFAAMVAGIRQVERALGDGEKRPMPSELKTMPIARKSIAARVPIRRGERLSADNLTVKRPGQGMAPITLWELIGRAASRDYQADDLIVEDL